MFCSKERLCTTTARRHATHPLHSFTESTCSTISSSHELRRLQEFLQKPLESFKFKFHLAEIDPRIGLNMGWLQRRKSTKAGQENRELLVLDCGGSWTLTMGELLPGGSISADCHVVLEQNRLLVRICSSGGRTRLCCTIAFIYRKRCRCRTKAQHLRNLDYRAKAHLDATSTKAHLQGGPRARRHLWFEFESNDKEVV